MSRCTNCSSRALELFIKDLAGLHLRTAPRQFPRRNFSTRRPLRQLESVQAGVAGVEDGFIPFEFEALRKARHQRKEKVDGARDVEKEAVDEEWHAEIEIQGQWPRRTRDMEAEPTAEANKRDAEQFRTATSSEAKEIEARSTMDMVALRNLHPTKTTSARQSMAVPILPSTTLDVSPGATASTPSETRSRAENRLARKQRRMMKGVWNPRRAEQMAQSTAQEQVDEDANPVASVLEQIEKLPGPAIEAKQRKEKKAKAVASNDPSANEAERSRKQAEETHSGKKAARAGPKSTTKETTATTKPKPPPKETWKIQKAALKAKFGPSGWDPSKKLSPDTMNGIRALHASDPTSYTTANLAQHFEITPEAIRRILKSKWRPDEEQVERRRVAWEKRGVRKWEDMAAKGMRPPKQWRELGVPWERKSRSAAPRSRGVRRATGMQMQGAAIEEGVGMLTGIEGEIDERLD